ncbi:hypothetical protein QVD17_31423 [Tagetes erecta]|uniref:PGG domain-containing protein n=1 Tax=Tagetes erecta TaxID=13708 RepID=A0AAD8NPB0_TARER|nr:hypothetical protein QVD17_31423 [Tagetes erecta]
MMPPYIVDSKNKDGQTPYELFSKENEDFITKGLKWMKDCMVVATLIITVAFAVAFTVPGGYNQDHGFPIFLHKPAFLVFVIADAISLFSSSTSLLVFLFILISHHEEQDFLNSLPRLVMIGLLGLFISLAAMMVTFSASFFVLYHKGLKWVPILIAALATLPVFLFAVLQTPLWVDMFRATYEGDYLFNSKRRVLYPAKTNHYHIVTGQFSSTSSPSPLPSVAGHFIFSVTARTTADLPSIELISDLSTPQFTNLLLRFQMQWFQICQEAYSGVNFAIYSHNAASATLCLMSPSDLPEDIKNAQKTCQSCIRLKMDNTMKQFQEKLIEIEIEAENLLLARHELVENDRMRNGNREALTALRKRARTTTSSVPSPFKLLMKEIDDSKPLVKEVCATCGNHDSKERTWMMFSGTDIFARIPFHAAHTILEKVNREWIWIEDVEFSNQKACTRIIGTILRAKCTG